MAEINYDEIRTEYLNSNISFASLAKKHNIAHSSISRRAKKEKWDEIKAQMRTEVNKAVQEQTIEEQQSIATKCIRILTKLVDKVEESVDIVEPSDISAKRQLVGMMKDLNEMGAFSLETDTDKGGITVTLEKQLDEYGE